MFLDLISPIPDAVTRNANGEMELRHITIPSAGVPGRVIIWRCGHGTNVPPTARIKKPTEYRCPACRSMAYESELFRAFRTMEQSNLVVRHQGSIYILNITPAHANLPVETTPIDEMRRLYSLYASRAAQQNANVEITPGVSIRAYGRNRRGSFNIILPIRKWFTWSSEGVEPVSMTRIRKTGRKRIQIQEVFAPSNTIWTSTTRTIALNHWLQFFSRLGTRNLNPRLVSPEKLEKLGLKP